MSDESIVLTGSKYFVTVPDPPKWKLQLFEGSDLIFYLHKGPTEEQRKAQFEALGFVWTEIGCGE